MEPITNIVPNIEPGEVKPEETIDQNSFITQTAIDYIAFAEAEFPNEIGGLFWKIVIEKAQERIASVEVPAEPVVAMEPKQKKAFLQTQLPWGKYVGMKMETVVKKDRLYLEDMAKKPLPFQLRLRQFLNSLPPLKIPRNKEG